MALAFNAYMLADGFEPTPWYLDYSGWLIVLAFVLVLLVIGSRDVLRFSLKRVWAISGVCFAESIRKRILLITPLALLGVIGVTLLQHADDQQDAVRQTIKYAVFACGLVAIMTSIILASTNLPKEIETRVIYTIVTKPTTRLELVLGKIIGFARVSLTILLIMGLFTWGFLRVLEKSKENEITRRLAEGDLREAERDRLNHYHTFGLLGARVWTHADRVSIYGRDTGPGIPQEVLCNSGDEEMMTGSIVDPNIFYGPKPADGGDDAWAHQGIGELGMVIQIEVNTKRTGKASDQNVRRNSALVGPEMPLAPEKVKELPPLVTVELRDTNFYTLTPSAQIIGATNLTDLLKRVRQYSRDLHILNEENASAIRLSDPMPTADGHTAQFAYAWVPSQVGVNLFGTQAFFIRLAGGSRNVDYILGDHPLRLFIPQIVNGKLVLAGTGATEISLDSPDTHKPVSFFRGTLGIQSDQQLRGSSDPTSGVAVYRFPGVGPSEAQDKNQSENFEVTLEVSRGGADAEEGKDDTTTLNVRVANLVTGESATRQVRVESRQPAFFAVPKSILEGGQYELAMHCINPGRLVGFYSDSVKTVLSQESFEFNLAKSLSILWMMSILVIVIAVLCSTFLSWPIAIVLTVILLLGHWAVDQVSDAGPGLGRRIVNDLKLQDVGASAVISSGVDNLMKSVSYVSMVLPDTGKFNAIDDVDSGSAVTMERMWEAMRVLLQFALPATIAAYLILRGVEVAP